MRAILYVLLTSTGLLFFACSKSTSGPDEEGEQQTLQATFSSIQENIFTPKCATSGCHAGSQQPILTAWQAYNNLVNKTSLQQPSLMRVKAGDSANIYLIKKLKGDGTTVMPSSGMLPQATVDKIAEWINNGALNN